MILFLALGACQPDPKVADTAPADTSAACEAPITWYADADGDGFGDPAVVETACLAPEGYVADATDCDDSAADVHPGATEIWYDGADEDCGGDSDFDQDGDGYDRDAECDDTDPELHPGTGVAEVWYDGVDQDCDGNDGDQDGDGYYVAGYAFAVPAGYHIGDCWDDPAEAHAPLNGLPAVTAADVHPDADEGWYDGIDGDCAGDDDFDADADTFRTSSWPDEDGALGGDCADGDPAVYPGAADAWYDGLDADCAGDDDWDADGDGYDAAGGSGPVDCADDEYAVHPDAVETCDGRDEDCDGATDEGTGALYTDADGDGHGASGSPASCSGTAATADDCDDDDAGVHPDVPETCDGRDEDCDGATDEGTGALYLDADGDGHGASGSPASCSGTAATADDCDDADAGVHPDVPETCDGRDEDCDGATDEGLPVFYADADDDGFGAGEPSCAEAGVATAGDCDDADPRAWPGAPELCDGERQDCAASYSSASEAGRAALLSADGTWTDVTASLSGGSSGSPRSYILADGATLHLCQGHWYARVALSSSSATGAVVGPWGAGETILDGAGGRPLSLDTASVGADVELRGVTFTGGAGADGGGAAVALDSLLVEGCAFASNEASGGGGALYLLGGAATLRDTTFYANRSVTYGGAIFSLGTDLTLENVTFAANEVVGGGGGGGAVYWADSADSTLTVAGCSFDGNGVSNATGTAYAGGLLVSSASSAMITVSDTTFTDNTAATSGTSGQGVGGGAYFVLAGSGSTVLSDVTFDGNVASGPSTVGGGGLFITNSGVGEVAMVGGAVTANAGVGGGSGAYGGGVFLAAYGGGDVTLDGVDVSGNDLHSGVDVPVGQGGGVFVQANGATIGLAGTSVTANGAASAGGVYVATASAGTVSLEAGTVIADNASTGVTYAPTDTASHLALTDSVVSGNVSHGVRLTTGASGARAELACTGASGTAAGVYANDGYGVLADCPGGSTCALIATLCDFDDPASSASNALSDVFLFGAGYDYGLDETGVCDDRGCW